MAEPANSRTGNLQALLDSKLISRLATMISPRFANAEITQGMSRNTGNRESGPLYRGGPLCRAQGPCGHLQIETVRHSEGALTAHGRTNSNVESRRATATNAIFPEGLYRAHFDSLVSGEAREVVAGKIKNQLARVGKFPPGSICTRKLQAPTRDRSALRSLFRSERRHLGVLMSFHPRARRPPVASNVGQMAYIAPVTMTLPVRSGMSCVGS